MESFELEPKVHAEFYNPRDDVWEEIWPAVSKIEDECFPGKGLGEAYLREIFENEKSVVVLLKQGKEVIGFTCGIPDERGEGAVYIETTEITPVQQGRGYVTKLMNLLEQESRRRGYKFLTRDAEIANGYADKIAKNYEGRILESHEHESEDSMGGRQMFFKIAL